MGQLNLRTGGAAGISGSRKLRIESGVDCEGDEKVGRGVRWYGLGMLVAAVGLAGCGSSGGGSTSCSSFESMSTGSQKGVVINILKQHGQSTSGAAVDVAWLSAKGYCFVHSGTATVGGITGG